MIIRWPICSFVYQWHHFICQHAKVHVATSSLKEITIKSSATRISYFVLVHKSSDEVADWRGVVVDDEVRMFGPPRSHCAL